MAGASTTTGQPRGGPGGAELTREEANEYEASPAAGRLAPARFLAPMLAQAGTLPLSPEAQGAGHPGAWLLEPKLDGLRCIAVRNGPEVSLWSRNRLPYNDRFPWLAAELASLAAGNFVLDGEVVAMVGGRPDFAGLQQGGAAQAQYWCFDLLWLLGRDVRHLAIEERKRLLSQLVGTGRGHIKLVEPLQGEPGQLLAKACEQGWEGLVAKRVGSAYRPGRSADWRKLKCGGRQEMVIGGFTAPRGARQGFGALLLGYWDGGRLRYAGKVGTGFSGATLKALSSQLALLERPSSPFAELVREKGARWAEPVLVAEVAFSNWTPDGRLRHPRFMGLRPDKPSRQVRREPAGPKVPLLPSHR